MLFQREKLRELVAEAVSAHGVGSKNNDSSDPLEANLARFWRLWIDMMDLPPVSERDKFSPCSEYEVYFNWLLARHPDAARLRSFVSLNSGRRRELDKFQREAKYDWVAFHSYLVRQQNLDDERASSLGEEGCAAAAGGGGEQEERKTRTTPIRPPPVTDVDVSDVEFI